MQQSKYLFDACLRMSICGIKGYQGDPKEEGDQIILPKTTIMMKSSKEFMEWSACSVFDTLIAFKITQLTKGYSYIKKVLLGKLHLKYFNIWIDLWENFNCLSCLSSHISLLNFNRRRLDKISFVFAKNSHLVF